MSKLRTLYLDFCLALTRVGAQLATIALGVLIFVDDYFNCLTVGSVMRPVTDTHNISRAKLAYLIDATAAPVCIIAPISSWAAAVCRRRRPRATYNGIAAVHHAPFPITSTALLTIVMMMRPGRHQDRLRPHGAP